MQGTISKTNQAETSDVLSQFALRYLTDADQQWAMQQLERCQFSHRMWNWLSNSRQSSSIHVVRTSGSVSQQHHERNTARGREVLVRRWPVTATVMMIERCYSDTCVGVRPLRARGV